MPRLRRCTLKTTKPLEREILKSCLAVLAARGVVAWRNNTGAFAAAHNGVRRFVRFGMVGASDIIGVLPDGRFLAVEVKRPGRKPGPKQVGFIKSINGQGGVAFWVDDAAVLDMVLEHVLGGAFVELDEELDVVILVLEEAS